jgi:hypothetical protein
VYAGKNVPDTPNDRSIAASRRSILELMAAPAVLSALQHLAYPLPAPAAATGLALPDDATYQAVRKAFQRNATKGKVSPGTNGSKLASAMQHTNSPQHLHSKAWASSSSRTQQCTNA